jgi:signal transduction histidine kinase
MDTKGIRFKLLAFFFIFSVIILGLLWMLQVVFMSSFYQTMKRSETEVLGKDIVSNYGMENYSDYVKEVAFRNELTVLIFTIEENTIYIEYSGGRGSNDGPQQMTQYLNDFINRIQNESIISYLSDKQEGFETLVYGEKMVIDGETVYFYVNASLIPVGSTTSVLSSQLIIVTIICILLALGISFLISKTLSKPLVEITKSAEKLAAGDLKANFDIPGGYSEIQKLSDTLNYATMELSKTDNLRKELIANVSHEIKTPLTMIKAYAEHIRDLSGEKKDKRESNIKVILEESDRLNKLVNDILDLAKLPAKLSKYNITQFDISNSIKRIYNNFVGIYESQGYSFFSNIDEDVIVEGDEAKLEQVMYNLIGNAINYSNDRKEITVSLKKYPDSCRLEVSDRGLGIDPEELPYVFDRYFRTSEGGRVRYGSGIGLSIVKSILEGHGYKYGVNSALGEGSTFYVVIPLKV